MTKFLPEAAARSSTSSVARKVVAMPVTGVSGSPALKVSTVCSLQEQWTFFWMRSMTSRAVRRRASSVPGPPLPIPRPTPHTSQALVPRFASNASCCILVKRNGRAARRRVAPWPATQALVTASRRSVEQICSSWQYARALSIAGIPPPSRGPTDTSRSQSNPSHVPHIPVRASCATYAVPAQQLTAGARKQNGRLHEPPMAVAYFTLGTENLSLRGPIPPSAAA